MAAVFYISTAYSPLWYAETYADGTGKNILKTEQQINIIIRNWCHNIFFLVSQFHSCGVCDPAKAILAVFCAIKIGL